tara:strand:- start:118 stop:849 length:732 start_codon:yes stop_codon:yes gene_type:complete
MWPKISNKYSPNFGISKRSKSKIKFIIIHYTGMNKELSAIERLCNIEFKVSAHYFIKKNGSVLNLVPPRYEAWHAGVSSWKSFKSLNRYSIGIEIQNSGHENSYENYSSKQIISIKGLIKYLMGIYNISHKNVLGHSDVAPDRKKDPGEKFPWKELAKLSLSQWHNLDEKKIKKKRLKKLNFTEERVFLHNLTKIGYPKLKIKNTLIKKRLLISAFQRRFRQNLINGLPDQECLIISKNLIRS